MDSRNESFVVQCASLIECCELLSEQRERKTFSAKAASAAECHLWDRFASLSGLFHSQESESAAMSPRKRSSVLQNLQRCRSLFVENPWSVIDRLGDLKDLLQSLLSTVKAAESVERKYDDELKLKRSLTKAQEQLEDARNADEEAFLKNKVARIRGLLGVS